MPRIAPRPESDYDDDTRELVAKAAPGSRPLNIFATLAHHPKLLKRWLVFGNHVLSKSTLAQRDTELLILRTGWNCQSDYEWGQHVAIGLQRGLSREEIDRVPDGPDAAGWPAEDAMLLRAADELHRDNRIGDATWAALASRFSKEQLLDVIFTVGQYHTVAFALNSCGVEREPGVEGLPTR